MKTRSLAWLAVFLVALSSPVDAETEKPWVAASNANTRLVLEAQARFSPEDVSRFGLTEYDGLATDLGPRLSERTKAAMESVVTELKRRLNAEQDANVRQDLQILIDAVEDGIKGQDLDDEHFLAWSDVPGMVYGGIEGLLAEQVAPARRSKALELLQRYVGLFPGSTPLTEQARARFVESQAAGRLGPFRARVEQSIADTPTFAAGIRELFTRYQIAGADPALAALDKQLAGYAEWQRTIVLPVARTDFRLPPEVYAFRLEQVGIDVDATVLVARARQTFMETRGAMQALAPVVVKELGLAAGDYRDVIRQLKKNVIPNGELESRYADVNARLEAIILRERVVDLPERPMIMRLASAAESAAQPAPHMQPPPLIGNTGERGQFVLPVGNPAGAGEVFDDFNFPSATWTLSAHEGRPGHELQFSAMIERGVSLARSLFAFNSVNVEGWGLYAEAEMLPYEPVDAQMIALQHRLLRAARATLDPMLNLGLITREDAGKVLTDQVMLSPAMTRQELDRYTFRAPGQAGSYFYGYTRLLELRAETELALGERFDRMAFNNFLLDQGLLTPDQLAKVVREEFVPARLGGK